jgi:hypothetical protein
MDDRKTIRLGRGPAVADIDADIVARESGPLKFAIKRVVVAEMRKHSLKSRLAFAKLVSAAA